MIATPPSRLPAKQPNPNAIPARVELWDRKRRSRVSSAAASRCTSQHALSRHPRAAAIRGPINVSAQRVRWLGHECEAALAPHDRRAWTNPSWQTRRGRPRRKIIT